MLYPLKFDPIYKERVWGGSRLRERYDRMSPEGRPIGESYELSGVQGDVSVVAGGFLAGNELNELIGVYLGDLVGDRVYERFGEEFPVLVKLLDTKELLSIQVHPDNALAAERHGAYGKTELWYVMEADPGAYIYLGFNRPLGREEFLDRLEDHTLPEVMNRIEPKPGQVYFVPAGTIHSIGPGLLIAEIQQTSDITYRAYDWGRTGADGTPRALHVSLALDALEYNRTARPRLSCAPETNRAVPVCSCAEFAVEVIDLDGRVERERGELDSFTIYLCVEGEAIVECAGGAESLLGAETVLVPAEFDTVSLSGKGRLLEIYMPRS